MSEDAWGFADIYSMDAEADQGKDDLPDVRQDEWRNILVVGRATKTGVYPETLALVGRARYLADELGCRVEVLLIGSELDAATEVLGKYPINTVYRVAAEDYAPIDATAKILEEVVRKRRPELVMGFQSRTGDAVIAYAANRLGVGFIHGAVAVDIDTYERRARATSIATNTSFTVTSEFQDYPQFVSVQRGMFRAPMEDPYAAVKVYDLDLDIGPRASIEVLERRPPAAASIDKAERVVVVGARVHDGADIEAAKRLAERLDAVVAVGRSVHDRGLAEGLPIVGVQDGHIAPRLLVAVGVRGSLDLLGAISGDPVICAIGCDPDDPISRHAAYLVAGDVGAAVADTLAGL